MGIRGVFAVIFGGYSGVFVGIRGYSRAFGLCAWISLLMLKTNDRLSFSTYFLCGAHQGTNTEKPENLVEQTFYIILIPQNEVVAALAPGAFVAGAS